MEFEEILIAFFKDVGLDIDDIDSLEGLIVCRDSLLDINRYKVCLNHIPIFRTVFSSSYMTALQSTAEEYQKFPLINLLRQVLKIIKFDLKPRRISDGYTLDKKKKYKRIFVINKV